MRADRNEYPHPRLPKLSRAQLREMDAPMWVRLARLRGDNLAFRELTLRVHGRQTLVNMIYHDHKRLERSPYFDRAYFSKEAVQ